MNRFEEDELLKHKEWVAKQTYAPEGWTIEPSYIGDNSLFFNKDISVEKLLGDPDLWGFGKTRQDCIEQINQIIIDRGM